MPVIELRNCLWLLAPILVWNAVFGARLPQPGFKSDAGVPRPILLAEQALRVAAFAWPLFLPLRWETPAQRAGVALYAVGALIYFASWLPLVYAPESAWSRSAAGLLGPAYTPLLWMWGIALIGGAWPYALVAAAFVAVHMYHNVLAHGLHGGGAR
jgi:hypothetical protein